MGLLITVSHGLLGCHISVVQSLSPGQGSLSNKETGFAFFKDTPNGKRQLNLSETYEHHITMI